jgi:ABC-type Fe3+/spermidine/putrescine transport system ATPase subunit
MRVEIRALTKRYGDVVALADADVAIEPGSFTTLLGPSGSGKSTLLMCLAGFIEPTSGCIEVDGRDIVRTLPEERGFGVVFQGYALFPHLSVAGNIAYPLRMRRLGRREIEERVSRMLQLVQLEGLRDRRPSELSGGQQQRVALARALAFDPRIVLLDEPLSALDRALRGTLRGELKRIHEETGTTFLMVTHDQEEALSLSDTVVVLNHGRIVQSGPPAEIYNRPASRFVAGFIGMTNLWDVTVEAVGDDGIVVSRASDGTRLRSRPLPDRSPSRGTVCLMSVRPEAITFGRPDADGSEKIAGTIVGSSFEGFDQVIDVDTSLGPQKVRLRSRAADGALRRGDRVTLSWPDDAAHLIPKD